MKSLFWKRDKPTSTLRQAARRRSRVRLAVQVFFSLFVLAIVLSRQAAEAGVVLPMLFPDLHGICPFGAIATASRLLLQGEYIPRTGEANLWVLAGSLGMTFLVGALFCGWLCPLGSIQDWFGRLGKRLLGRRYNRLVPARVDRLLSYLRYAVLALVVLQTTRFLNLWFTTFDPYYAMYHIWTGNALPSAIAVLAVTLVASLFVARPWCRWLCPFGALQGLAARLSPWTIRRNDETCTSCLKCSRACPMGIAVAQTSAVRDSRCTRCMECLDACPVDGALDFTLRAPQPASAKPTDRRPAAAFSISGGLTAAAVVLMLFFAPVGLARATGLYVPASHEAETQLEVADIGPMMTLEEVGTGLGMSTAELLALLEIDPGFDPTTLTIDVEMDERYEHLTLPQIRRVLEALDGQ
ncbi:MAG: 4Fe-4S binding protein [Spirochaetaceae bacterium]|nr:4Fe-4S binding protein [Spirochaetaceae bacterium]